MRGLPIQRYSVSLLAVTGATVIWLLLGRDVEPSPFPLFFAAVAISSLCGAGPGLSAGVSGAAAIMLLYVRPTSTSVHRDIIMLGAYLAVSCILAWFGTIRGRTEREHLRLLAEERAARAEAEMARQRYYDLVHNLDAIVWEVDPVTCTYLFVSEGSQAVLGYPAARWMEEEDFWPNIVHPDDREEVLRRANEAAEHGGSYSIEYRVIAADGREIVIEDQAYARRDAEGRLRSLRGVMVDITARKEAERQERAAREEAQAAEALRMVIDASPIAIQTFDLEGKVTGLNPAAEKLFGWTEAEAVGRVHPYTPEDKLDEYHEAMRQAIAGGSRFEARRKRKDASPIDLDISTAPIRDASGRTVGVLGVVADITERKQAQAALVHQAMHDALTGLPNRSLLRDRLQQAVLSGRRDHRSVALLLMDLDRFKVFNDTFGHHYGDILLKEVAGRLRALVRESDTVARLGGDEFAVVLPDTDAIGAIRIAEKILAAFGLRFDLEEQAAYVGVSVGIAIYPNPGEDASALMQRADVAMYVAKRGSTGYAVYSPEHDQNSPLKLMLASDLRDGIERNQLVLHYQPQMEVLTGRITGLEALVRWQHPKHGLVPPAEFIPLSEDTGLVIPLTRWALAEAVQQADAFHHHHLELEIAVNLSARSLHDPSLTATVRGLLDELPSNAGLKLEIAESAIMLNPDRAVDTLTELHAMGVRIALDDFGTGYSSLAYLKSLPLDEIKIDQSFVIGMTANADDITIVQAVIELGHNLGLRVVAEGVENGRTCDILATLGCDVIQGFYLSKPLPASEAMYWLSERTAEQVAS